MTLLYPHYLITHYSHTPRHLQLILSSYLTRSSSFRNNPGCCCCWKALFHHDFPQLYATASPLISVHPLKTASSFVPDHPAPTTMTSLPWPLCSPHGFLLRFKHVSQLGVLHACKPSINKMEAEVFQFRDQPQVTWQDPNQSVCAQLN